MEEQMTDHHPITPPPELVQKWAHLPADWDTLASLIAQWGADRQLEADAEWLDQNSLDASHLTITPTGKGLIEAMRPKRNQILAIADELDTEALPDKC